MFTGEIRGLFAIIQSWEAWDASDQRRPLSLQILSPYALMDRNQHPHSVNLLDDEAGSIRKGKRYLHSYLRLVGLDVGPDLFPVVRRITGLHITKLRTTNLYDFIRGVFRKRKIRWAASVYGRYLPILKGTAEKILKERYRYEGHNISLQWMTEEVPLHLRPRYRVTDFDEDHTDMYSDGSRIEGAAAAATTESATYLGLHATVMDAEIGRAHV